MTSCEFEKIAKTAVLIELLDKFEIKASITDIDLVWFAHELGHKKCTIWGKPMGELYAEVTYNSDRDEIYIDIYSKISNCAMPVKRIREFESFVKNELQSLGRNERNGN